MDLTFSYKGSTVGTSNGVNRTSIIYDASDFYMSPGGAANKIDCIEGAATGSGERLTIEADGTAAGLEWHVLVVTHSYDKNAAAGIPATSAGWGESATNKLELKLTGPSTVDHEARWDFTGPSLPPPPLKVIIKRTS